MSGQHQFHLADPGGDPVLHTDRHAGEACPVACFTP